MHPASPSGRPRPPIPPEHPARMLQHLPEDVQKQLLSLLPQPDQAHLASSCRAFHALAEPFLRRVYRCVSCRHPLFHPRELHIDPEDRRRQLTYGPTSKLPRRCFFRLRAAADVAALGMALDDRRGAANFHVLRHLAQTVYRQTRFPLPQELQAVRALRCANCRVFVGFRHDDGEVRDFVHHDFVELVDGKANPVTLAGDLIPEPEKTVRCANPACRRELFERDDVLPWSHVLASSRLTDLDAYLEWDHSWSGAATASQPAFFVKRLRAACSTVRHVRPERLRQGNMVVADVHCAGCDRQIGWKFVDELVEGADDALLHNYDQVGRFGIIRNAVAPAEPRNV